MFQPSLAHPTGASSVSSVSSSWAHLLDSVVGSHRSQQLRALVAPPDLPTPASADTASREHIAFALALVLFGDVLDAVPLGRAYALECATAGTPLRFDHGGVRTVAAPCGQLPPGARAIARILEPLGYIRTTTYPLPALGMTGYAYTHVDFPEALPQYFVSELHPERFSAPFAEVVSRVISRSTDPIAGAPTTRLEKLVQHGTLDVREATALLPELRAAFDRQHPEPLEADYQQLLAHSDEMAWIATEGQRFNHATDRVPEVEAVCERQRQLGRPIKKEVSVSTSGRVRQSAFLATPVRRLFRTVAGHFVEREVPGSFWEFISRERLPDGRLDLGFDAGNATAIFAMTTRDRGNAA